MQSPPAHHDPDPNAADIVSSYPSPHPNTPAASACKPILCRAGTLRNKIQHGWDGIRPEHQERHDRDVHQDSASDPSSRALEIPRRGSPGGSVLSELSSRSALDLCPSKCGEDRRSRCHVEECRNAESRNKSYAVVFPDTKFEYVYQT